MIKKNMLTGMDISLTNKMINFLICILKEIINIKMSNIHFI